MQTCNKRSCPDWEHDGAEAGVADVRGALWARCDKKAAAPTPAHTHTPFLNP